MPRPRARHFRPAICAFILGAGLLQAAPAGAQVLIYEEPYGRPPRYVAPPPPVGNAMLRPAQIQAIVRGMGYRNVSIPRLRGRVYAITATDEEGPALLRIDAFTGRVLAAAAISGGPTTAIPAQPPHRRPAPPRAAQRPAPPPPPAAVPGSAALATPLPPARPPEAAVAIAPSAPAVPAEPAKGDAITQGQSAPVAGKEAGGQGAAGKDAAGKGEAVAVSRTEPTPPSASGSIAASNPAPAPQPPKRTTGAGTATTDSAAAGSASVISKPKAP